MNPGFSVYLIWHAGDDGDVDIEAHVQPDSDPAPGEVVPSVPRHPPPGRYVTRPASGLPERVGDWIARGWISVMRHTAAHGPPAPLSLDVANGVLVAMAESDEALRHVVQGIGRRADEESIELVVGTAFRDLGGWPPEAQR